MSTGTRITLAEFGRMAERGEFDPVEENRVELIRGEIREKSPIYPPHEFAVDQLAEWSFNVTNRKQVRVRTQQSLGISELESVPVPDLTWVQQLDYRRVRPTVAELLLLVEVAETSLQFDREEKAMLYAEAGIQDYWIVNVKAKAIEVRRKPIDGVYTDVQTFTDDEVMSPLALPTAKLTAVRIWSK